MPAWLFGGIKQRTKRLEKSASEGDTRIDDSSGGAPQMLENGADASFVTITCQSPRFLGE